jgi:DNA-binding response OmpR family regulator
MRLLIAEDDRTLREAIVRGLREQTYAVDAVENGEDAVVHAAINDYDAIVLDVLMPRRDGLEVCRELRRRGNTVPILLLTALDAVEDRIDGLDAGADDYLAKPFAFGELLARVRALLRRQRDMVGAVLTVEDLEVDTRRQAARRGVREIALSPKEYALLEYLARHTGRIVSRTELTAHVWDDNHDPASNTLDVYISRLRRKIDGGEAVPLLSVRRGAGCMLGPTA